MKNVSLPIAIVIAVIGCALAVNAFITSSNLRQNVQEERYKRMVAEEHLQNNKNDMAKIKADLTAAQQTLASIQQLVNKGKDTNSELKSELEQLRQERDMLKQQLGKNNSAGEAVPEAGR